MPFTISSEFVEDKIAPGKLIGLFEEFPAPEYGMFAVRPSGTKYASGEDRGGWHRELEDLLSYRGFLRSLGLPPPCSSEWG